MLRQARLDSPGTLHHVIIRGIEKKQIVDDKYDRMDLLKRIGEVAERTGTFIYAWSFMTNHGRHHRPPNQRRHHRALICLDLIGFNYVSFIRLYKA